MAPSTPATAEAAPRPLPKVGVSRCLLGDEVRFDGGHKQSRFIRDTLATYVTFVRVCPELEVGMGVPRETVRLVQVDPDRPPRVRGTRSDTDWTDRMEAWADTRLASLQGMGLRGFLLKRSSPSCGLFRMKVYLENGMPHHAGQGLFARRLCEAFPNLPMEEEGRLGDARLRENFLTRVFVYDDWLTLREQGASAKALVDFHARHKLLVLAHDQARYRQLGPLVADAGKPGLEARLDAYEALLMAALAKPAKRRGNLNAMEHLCGFLKDLPSADKAELRAQMTAYREGIVPLAVPMTLLRHHLRHRDHGWALGQRYLAPTPPELGLNAVL